MKNNTKNIICPNCKTAISIDDVLTHQIEENIKKEISEENKLKEIEMAKERKEIEEQKAKLEELQKNTQSEVSKKVAEKLAVEKITLWKEAQTAAEKKTAAEVKLLEEQMKEKDKKLDEANTESLKARAIRQKFEDEKKNFEVEKAKIIDAERKGIEQEAFARAVKQSERDSIKLLKQIEEAEKEKEADKKMLQEQLEEKDIKLKEANKKELDLRKEKNKLEEDKQNFELEKQRQLDIERKQIIEEASKKANEEQKYIIAQLEKRLTDATKAKDELSRKLEQGSQQTQGEVLELELEDILRSEFSFDDISPVPKGVSGADIIQKVQNQSGKYCGQIVWESKKTKAWSEGWIQKLKDDQRIMKAEIAVIVSITLPGDIKGFGFRDGVWICDIKLATALATALRVNLESVTREKTMSVGKNDKMEILYTYLTGVEFKQRVEAIVEAFTGMDNGLKKERLAYEKIWSEREKQIKKVITNTVGMYGDLSGLVALPQIKRLELGEGDE
ncbi:MAG: hypothetical protein UR25_C0004G0019 [Candidatus Nomurabacteria bacterium GW2011_GWE1_32_28]|uniref:DUF2130 domain-containing protein n=1 Tax=Candidatus Nomurabacteria bacterium GW2011_GWF1_31_48 TaxID=1618767 RepID=A0A0G0AU46_9BACT|nr:MAG: hypothetical protein UR10_C0004G0018 [Candidatus Nomurabacteria bacterium GW2011_GWF2_30_133]KKP28515.1 MAG: hypothetical protein UR18_C0003G0018 [Candidatus Nomurabacteria bacterium GW2011_GWE2_31_40]KKP30110.1 MAG: hypothetical protein UR19_C0004G0018 [Candidatus Nomurabacteria bacterium GW2011_GWF1_31_48]KKP34655.1 MAG: hypothetical protein UR25_C0004G0019 [Candidatus Nomurabacteria bacterium GW2011_GWE1_32_28]HAS80884.1 hypothetical protein [Candidatus Nomurabacteria bacterium]